MTDAYLNEAIANVQVASKRPRGEFASIGPGRAGRRCSTGSQSKPTQMASLKQVAGRLGADRERS